MLSHVAAFSFWNSGFRGEINSVCSIITGAAPSKCCQLPTSKPPAQTIWNLGKRLSTLVLWIVTFSFCHFLQASQLIIIRGHSLETNTWEASEGSKELFQLFLCTVLLYLMCIHLSAWELIFTLHTHLHSQTGTLAETSQQQAIWNYVVITYSEEQLFLCFIIRCRVHTNEQLNRHEEIKLYSQRSTLFYSLPDLVHILLPVTDQQTH